MLLLLLKCCFTSTETVGLLGTGAQDVHLDSCEDVPLVEFKYLVFTRLPGESYRRRFRSLLLYLCYVFRALINSLVCSDLTPF